ncbi:HTH-type transcriptional regulator ZntR [Enterobacter cloacae]|uniref:MerR family DNA-binding transcriptional regulator n=1 Tax=Enterobacter sichuanensis TaxID=2071710 RepID=A0AAE4IZP6_9ENTR|nr:MULTISPECIES: MerR family DNA-binding transcriptional regulator [Enterobacter]CAF2446037.1 HTH-type transcriptional regulator ZntR [Enterobacter cloacae]MBO2911480.1 MerR family DNA-binding transcriptional regulator [Enterobacter sichuanensis]MBO2931667.1 MerR family DNA-binding transcriptional regulator [Enterobacter sichuanensis]MCI8904064.1 MerR family DNA-binding transcriptional regulator [Enterobacter sp.]MDR9947002.1 MerR family DNA-binding transcriptional regulator [Enterobacter sich
MKIGELSKMTGIAPSRIRFYEAQGLLPRPVRQENGYRAYSTDAATLLNIIDNAQRTGFTLEQIRRFLPQPQQRWDHEGLIQSLKTRIAEIEAMQKQLEKNRKELLTLVASLSNRPEGITCDDNMQRLLGQLQHSDGSTNPSNAR